ncbi:hypothetical protein B0J11DRAFT_586505 [Dendryphion nanum]|uniref:Uncharacterized protein n=1 Tax=Dendryphion nanum TaxID=256645 RepID=A0A9P9CZ01_9PLEO|nr:hypothetical protein B0J11DRAFT_586505 [Dendryphion nanum]
MAPLVDDDPSTASDALSLHTIADQADAYAAQEQEDADFALALQLEEEETQRLIASSQQAQAPLADETVPEPEIPPGDPPPYRDDPDADEIDVANLPPYRDDPEAAEPAAEDAESTLPPAPLLPRILRVVGTVRTLRKIWLCGTCILGLVTFIIIGAVVLLLVVFGKPADPREAAWKASMSRDYDLKLHDLYPALEDNASDDCKRTWRRFASAVNCHRMILSSAWDNGDVDEFQKAGVDPFGYADDVCTENCRDSIETLRNPTDSMCYRRIDRFDLTNYGKNGKMYFDKKIVEEGPRHAYLTLHNRYERLCAKVPKKRTKGKIWESSPWGTCAAEMWMEWGIAEGANVHDLQGIDAFIAQTSEKKTLEGGWKSGEIKLDGGRLKKYNVKIPTRKVGPGFGATECSFCIFEYLERIMMSFEYGKFVDAKTGKAIGLQEFWDKTYFAVTTCQGYYDNMLLSRVYTRWETYGLICPGKGKHRELCKADPISEQLERMRAVVHGSRRDDPLFQDIREQIANENGEGQTKALQLLHDGMLELPCMVWFEKPAAQNLIVPHQYLIDNLCGDRCRNAVGRLEERHGQTFANALDAMPSHNRFQGWVKAQEVLNKTCFHTNPHTMINSRTAFCAPGLAALGHPEWVFTGKGSRPEILQAFSVSVDALAKKVPHYPTKPRNEPDIQATLSRQIDESVCNNCVGDLLVGNWPDAKTTIDGFYDDKDIDGREYEKVAQKFVVTCTGLMGYGLYPAQKRELFKKLGLDRFSSKE